MFSHDVLAAANLLFLQTNHNLLWFKECRKKLKKAILWLLKHVTAYEFPVSHHLWRGAVMAVQNIQVRTRSFADPHGMGVADGVGRMVGRTQTRRGVFHVFPRSGDITWLKRRIHPAKTMLQYVDFEDDLNMFKPYQWNKSGIYRGSKEFKKNDAKRERWPPDWIGLTVFNNDIFCLITW